MSYPATERQGCGYAIRYAKWLYESGAANEVGPDATSILLAVVTMEDAFHYRRAPNFYNPQLMDRCGIRSEHAFIRARQTAIDAGLLSYTPGKKRTPGRYFVCGFTAPSAEEVGRNGHAEPGSSALCAEEPGRNGHQSPGCTAQDAEEAGRNGPQPPDCPAPSAEEAGRKPGESQALHTRTHTHTQRKKKGAASGGSSSAKGGDPYSEDFERFWVVYPRGRRQGKQGAWKAWKKAIRRTSPSRIIRDAEQYAGSPVAQGDYVKSPAAWLNQECWDDDRVAWGLQRDSGSPVSPPRAKAMRTPAQIAALDAEVAVG